MIYGIWNLDLSFFCMVYKPFCLHPSISIIQVICLDYVIAVYPLMLVFLIYFLVKLHDRFEMVQFIWRPAAQLLRIFHLGQQWNNIYLTLLFKHLEHLSYSHTSKSLTPHLMLTFLCLFNFIMSVDKLLDCTCITMAHRSTLGATTFLMQCWPSSCSLHLTYFYCFVSIPVDAFSPVLLSTQQSGAVRKVTQIVDNFE